VRSRPPAALACQISTRLFFTGRPSPSSTRPVTMMLSPQGLARVLAGQVVVELSDGATPVGGPVVSERVLGRMISGFFGALRRVAT
jgi:hypothetical protein